jgi:hypothetical protein
MKTKLLYILVSSSADVYTEQAWVSAFSARLRNPSARIELLTDGETELPEPMAKLFDNIVRVDFPSETPPMKRSRILKTGMREYVDGDFLFIDADTIVARPLDDIDAIDAPLVACRDLHSPFREHPHYTATVNMCRKIGFDASGIKEYFNSGVMLVKDTPENHAFFKAWQENYLSGYDSGIRPDQPSLAKTNSGETISLLPDVWNCEVQNGVRYLRDAYIVHYMVTNVGSGPQDSLFLLNRKEVLLRMREAGDITPEIRSMVEDHFKGYAPVTQVFAGEDLYLFRTRRYRWLRSHYRKGSGSLMEWLLKVKDHICQK